eukprot:7362342-Pyramimonas_sp.AAC.1
MEKHRLQFKKFTFSGEARPTYFLRPCNGRGSPGIECPESLCSRVTDLHELGAPHDFIHGTQWVNIPSALNVGLSCRSEDNPKKNG